MENISKWNVARKFEKRSLLVLVNAVAGLSIFFFGYDQGVMGGVNNTRDYAEVMGFGHYDPDERSVAVDKPLLQGGIVCILGSFVLEFATLTSSRLPSTISPALSLALF